ncbi:IclR family transcriptional regulator [Burkholderia multivorans]|uniref:IclR family transcriptional regulator n=1 Tax=Burkholderia multivorans TaxID=87883 RepID=A0AB37ANN3_9BURK|nr:IclR family transcriptional regulator [Burkholderia multivorans]MBU9589649.1 IclR family transcriptional regulator [Burkholderia multivorans]PRE39278.1 IclR family transcriptional regulator [Burkholderia multivorans]PRE42300.1 IclR family transcriptional regulator [Burkholderia multivorans]
MSTFANIADVLTLIARLGRGVTMTDVVNELNLPKSSASRTLLIMAENGFLQRDSVTRAYEPGPVIMAASRYRHSNKTTLDLLEGALGEMVEQAQYTGYITVLDGVDSVVIHMRPGAARVQVYTPPGSRTPAYATSIGQALLARLPDKTIDSLLQSARAGSKDSVPASADLLKHLAQVRERRWALSKGEYLDNVAGIGAAVRDPGTTTLYGVGVAVPANSLQSALDNGLVSLFLSRIAAVGQAVGDDYWLSLDAMEW